LDGVTGKDTREERLNRIKNYQSNEDTRDYVHPATDEDFSIQDEDGQFGRSQADIIELDAGKKVFERHDRFRKRNKLDMLPTAKLDL